MHSSCRRGGGSLLPGLVPVPLLTDDGRVCSDTTVAQNKGDAESSASKPLNLSNNREARDGGQRRSRCFSQSLFILPDHAGRNQQRSYGEALRCHLRRADPGASLQTCPGRQLIMALQTGQGE